MQSGSPDDLNDYVHWNHGFGDCHPPTAWTRSGTGVHADRYNDGPGNYGCRCFHIRPRTASSVRRPEWCQTEILICQPRCLVIRRSQDRSREPTPWMTNHLWKGDGNCGVPHDRRAPRPRQCSGSQQEAPGLERPCHHRHYPPYPGQRFSIDLRSANLTTLRSSVSTWLSHTLHLSTISQMGVSGGTLSRCRRRSQFGWLAMNRSRIRRVLVFGPISPKVLTASVSSAKANFDGSSPSCLTVLSNWRR